METKIASNKQAHVSNKNNVQTQPALRLYQPLQAS